MEEIKYNVSLTSNEDGGGTGFLLTAWRPGGPVSASFRGKGLGEALQRHIKINKELLKAKIESVEEVLLEGRL